MELNDLHRVKYIPAESDDIYPYWQREDVLVEVRINKDGEFEETHPLDDKVKGG